MTEKPKVETESSIKPELFYDNVQLGMDGSKKEIQGYIDVDGKRFSVTFTETKSKDPNIEPQF